LNNMFKLITIGNPVFVAEETSLFPVLKKIEPELPLETTPTEKQPVAEVEEITPAKLEINPEINYLEMFKEFIDKSDPKILTATTPRQLREKIGECYNTYITPEALKQSYKDNKQEIWECVRNKLY